MDCVNRAMRCLNANETKLDKIIPQTMWIWALHYTNYFEARQSLTYTVNPFFHFRRETRHCGDFLWEYRVAANCPSNCISVLSQQLFRFTVWSSLLVLKNQCMALKIIWCCFKGLIIYDNLLITRNRPSLLNTHPFSSVISNFS